ncbi:MAG: peptidoglycan DD-metalloendopeptidase family protein [Parcubacteria group bacterium]|nr:peptidoglycan DD-metalloendopeptidase family protein [Parcubacteria group bacterium]
MKKYYITFLVSCFLSLVSFTYAAAPEELREAIQQKAKQLDEISKQVQETQNKLQITQTQSKGIQHDIAVIDQSVNQLNLGIKSSEINLQKLGLELESLQYDIIDIGNEISVKHEAIMKILRELQQKDSENLLAILFKNSSLADSVFEMQTLADLNGGLSTEISDLKKTKDILNEKLDGVLHNKNLTALERSNLQNRKVIVQEQKNTKQQMLSQTKSQEKTYQQQLDDLVKLQADIAAEIEKAEAELRKNIDPNLLPIARPGVLLWPVPNPRITQGYGSTQFAILNYKGKYHNGIDLGGPIGTNVFAAEDGIVINVGDQDKFCPRGAYGKFIVIKHYNGLTTLYGHLSMQVVTIGQRVKRGDSIGYVGRTGYATGPHLHFTVFANNTLNPARPGFPEGTQPSRVCGPMPVGGDLNPLQYL